MDKIRILDSNFSEELDKLILFLKDKIEINDTPVFWIDLFSGAGGTSSGIHFSETNSFVVACVNHDSNAILSHSLNHPNTLHFIEDIRDFNVVLKLKELSLRLKKEFPNSYLNLWASLECTNFSNAKGGQPKDADSRTLGEHMFMYLKNIDVDYFFVENVREFMSWGPLDENGKPISKDKGVDYVKWLNNICSYGFHFEQRILNSADYGAYQSRKRLFIQFAKNKQFISWPEQTHTKEDIQNSLFEYKKWNPIKDVLDFDDLGNSIFKRKKPLSDKTLDVILKGIKKVIKENENVFLYKYYGNGDNYQSINDPSGTVTTNDRFAIVNLIFNQYKTGNTNFITEPSPTLTTNPKQNLLTFIMNPSHGGHTTSTDNPSPTIIARQDKAPLYLISVLMKEHGIQDVLLRMLKIPELKKIQGFPEDYNLVGNQKEQKKFIGNAVEVNMAKALISENFKTIQRINKKAA